MVDIAHKLSGSLQSLLIYFLTYRGFIRGSGFPGTLLVGKK